jgi:hypothetical protein
MNHILSKSAVLVLVLALMMVVLPNTTIPASAADTGFATPSLYANIPSWGTFNQPDEGRVSDDIHAVDASDNASVSYFGFGFSIPSGNTIDGIMITVEGHASTGSDKTFNVSLSYDNGTSWTATKNTGAMTTSDGPYIVGGVADNWGYASWTPAIINSDYFRVRLDVSGTGGNIRVDSTQAIVYYSLPGTTNTVATSVSPSTFGDSVTFTATVTRSEGTNTPTGTVDFLDGGVSIGTGTLSDIGGGAAQATLITSTLSTGSHAITAVYGGDSNFTGSTSSPIAQEVSQRNITVTADAQSKVYGESDPALTYQITSGSLVGGDGFTGAPTRVTGEAVGTYAIQQGTLALNSNYNLTYVEANLSITVRPTTVTADAQSRAYSDFDPALTYQITSGSLVFGDTFSGLPSRVAGVAVGTYAIQQGTLALNSNYYLTFVEGILTIMPPAPTLDGIGPDSGHAGETLDIIIDGSDFTGATAVDFGPGVTVNSFVVDSPTQITANVTIDSDASPGPRDVIVTTPSGDGTLTEAFSMTRNSPGILGSWWFWLLMCLVALALGLLLFLLFRRRKKETLWDVRARHAYTPVR